MEINLDIPPDTKAVMHIDETDHIGKWVAARGWYEQDLLDDARTRVTGPGTAVDVGAHMGNHTLWFALACGLDVVSLEPNPDTFKRLNTNIEANPDARILAINAAVALEPGRGTSTPAPEGNSGMAQFNIDADGDTPVFNLDSLELEDVKLIKIDVEGTAADVLRGGRRMIARDSPIIYAEGEQDEMAAALPRGYRCFGRFAHTPTYGFARRAFPARWLRSQ